MCHCQHEVCGEPEIGRQLSGDGGGAEASNWTSREGRGGAHPDPDLG